MRCLYALTLPTLLLLGCSDPAPKVTAPPSAVTQAPAPVPVRPEGAPSTKPRREPRADVAPEDLLADDAARPGAREAAHRDADNRDTEPGAPARTTDEASGSSDLRAEAAGTVEVTAAEVRLVDGADRGDVEPDLTTSGEAEPSRVDWGETDDDLTTTPAADPDLVDRGDVERGRVDRGDRDPDLTTNPGPTWVEPTPYLPPNAGVVGRDDE